MSRDRKPLSSVDAAWARMDQAGNPADIVVLMRLDGNVQPEELARLVGTHLLSRARFSRRVVAGGRSWLRPRWEKVESRVEDHLEVRCADGAGEGELRRLISTFISAPFDDRLPPWRLCLVRDVEGDSVLIAHLHHCLGDGFTLIEVLLELTEGNGRAAGLHGARPSGGRRVLSEGAAVLADLARVLVLPVDRGTRLRGDLSGERRVAWTRGIPLAALRRYAKTRGCTVNDVLMAAMSGALRRTLSASDALSASGGVEPVRAVVPVNLRAWFGSKDEERGNRFGLVFVDLPVDEQVAERRLTRVTAEMNRLKAGRQAWATLGLLALVGRAPRPLARLALSIFSRKATFVVSNVPGPPQKLRLAGREISELMFWVPHPQGLSCGASILSYDGVVRVGIRSDAAVLPDPRVLAEAVTQELESWLATDSPDLDHATVRPASSTGRSGPS